MAATAAQEFSDNWNKFDGRVYLINLTGLVDYDEEDLERLRRLISSMRIDDIIENIAKKQVIPQIKEAMKSLRNKIEFALDIDNSQQTHGNYMALIANYINELYGGSIRAEYLPVSNNYCRLVVTWSFQ